jgi:hypothetical protein
MQKLEWPEERVDCIGFQHACRELKEDHMTLGDYNVQPHDTIFVFFIR